MLNAATLKGKMSMLPDRQTVAVNFKNRTTPASVNVDGCTRRPVSADQVEYANVAGFGIPTATFMLPVANCAGNILKQGDEIVEANGTGLGGISRPWNVLGVKLELQGTVYRAFVSQE